MQSPQQHTCHFRIPSFSTPAAVDAARAAGPFVVVPCSDPDCTVTRSFTTAYAGDYSPKEWEKATKQKRHRGNAGVMPDIFLKGKRDKMPSW